ncbi:MAG: metal-sulfur cluster assembly factor [Candidatus Aminicenantia bacterium]
MITKDMVIQKLSEVVDPEIGLNIVEMGLIYDIEINGDSVNVKMALTAPGCPLQNTLVSVARDSILQIQGVKNANVQIVWDPPWHPSMMSEEARKKLGFS